MARMAQGLSFTSPICCLIFAIYYYNTYIKENYTDSSFDVYSKIISFLQEYKFIKDDNDILNSIEKNKLELENIKEEYTEIEIFDREIIIESLKKEFLKNEINDKKINAILIELIKKNVDTVVKQQKKEAVQIRELYDLKEDRNNITNMIDKINEKVKNSKLVVIPGADHLMHKNLPELLAEKIIENL